MKISLLLWASRKKNEFARWAWVMRQYFEYINFCTLSAAMNFLLFFIPLSCLKEEKKHEAGKLCFPRPQWKSRTIYYKCTLVFRKGCTYFRITFHYYYRNCPVILGTRHKLWNHAFSVQVESNFVHMSIVQLLTYKMNDLAFKLPGPSLFSWRYVFTDSRRLEYAF